MNTVTRAIITPLDNSDPVAHFLATMNDLFEYDFQDVNDSDMVGITIQNKVNQSDKSIGISFQEERSVIGRGDIGCI